VYKYSRLVFIPRLTVLKITVKLYVSTEGSFLIVKFILTQSKNKERKETR